MSGVPENRGMNYRGLTLLFEMLAEREEEFIDTIQVALYYRHCPGFYSCRHCTPPHTTPAIILALSTPPPTPTTHAHLNSSHRIIPPNHPPSATKRTAHPPRLTHLPSPTSTHTPTLTHLDSSTLSHLDSHTYPHTPRLTHLPSPTSTQPPSPTATHTPNLTHLDSHTYPHPPRLTPPPSPTPTHSSTLTHLPELSHHPGDDAGDIQREH
jgi:hypothetical protein